MNMQDLISAAILIATLIGGTVAAEKIHNAVREAALTKAAEGIPHLSHFAFKLTSHDKVVRQRVRKCNR
jgi:hypothetical protein